MFNVRQNIQVIRTATMTYLMILAINTCSFHANALVGLKPLEKTPGRPVIGRWECNSGLDLPPPATITVSANNVCPGATVTFSITIANNQTYLWYKNGVSTGIATPTYTGNTFQNNDQVSCYVTDNQGGTFSNVITMSVGSDQAPAINISASSANICTGTPVTFTAVAINGGTAPVYQWKINGIGVGTNANTYTTSNLNNNDNVTCTLLSNASCVVPVPVSSYSIFMNVSALVQPKGKIIATASTTCAGTPIDFSMNFTIGIPVSYQWKINGVNVSSASTFTSSNLADQDKISCDVIVNTQCSTGLPFSDIFTITVNPSFIQSVNISASVDSICQGYPVTFTAATINAGNNASYQWKINNVNAGINNHLFTTMALRQGDVVTCQVTSQGVPCLLNNTTLSNALTVKIFTIPSVTLPISQSVTLGKSIILNPVTNGNIIKYNWAPAIGLNNASVKNPVVTPLNDISYSLTVTSPGGCTNTASTSITVLGGKINVSNTFTPNNDGINDTWAIPNLVHYSSCTVDVFNRYGTKVFHTVGYAHPWDGRDNDIPVPVGVYYYIIDLKDGSAILTGSITIIR
jgi:gliding motility-associated-like protein